MNTADEQAAQDYYSILLTYIRELSKAHKGIRRLVRRNRKLEAERVTKRDEIMRAVCEMDDASEYSHRLINVDYDALYETVSEILEPPE